MATTLNVSINSLGIFNVLNPVTQENVTKPILGFTDLGTGESLSCTVLKGKEELDYSVIIARLQALGSAAKEQLSVFSKEIVDSTTKEQKIVFFALLSSKELVEKIF